MSSSAGNSPSGTSGQSPTVQLKSFTVDVNDILGSNRKRPYPGRVG